MKERRLKRESAEKEKEKGGEKAIKGKGTWSNWKGLLRIQGRIATGGLYLFDMQSHFGDHGVEAGATQCS